jgi:hypothetical protein
MNEAGAFSGLPLGLGIPLRKAGRRAVTACCRPLASHPSHLLGSRRLDTFFTFNRLLGTVAFSKLVGGDPRLT